MEAEEKKRNIRGSERFYPKACKDCPKLEHMKEFYADYADCLLDLEFQVLKYHYWNCLWWIWCTMALIAGFTMGYLCGSLSSIPSPPI